MVGTMPFPLPTKNRCRRKSLTSLSPVPNLEPWPREWITRRACFKHFRRSPGMLRPMSEKSLFHHQDMSCGERNLCPRVMQISKHLLILLGERDGRVSPRGCVPLHHEGRQASANHQDERNYPHHRERSQGSYISLGTPSYRGSYSGTSSSTPTPRVLIRERLGPREFQGQQEAERDRAPLRNEAQGSILKAKMVKKKPWSLSKRTSRVRWRPFMSK
ncbi:hypothetical protein NE237_033178 [Protea cynaroides]|uniref:Uncharacterized protein n=1 Tax=Protea cynaroides TaxID=273540 RepID=A0A9Q0L6H1_9MAGN|nr:hypothetical protein NE237_033178 [Protea cynaroides]